MCACIYVCVNVCDVVRNRWCRLANYHSNRSQLPPPHPAPSLWPSWIIHEHAHSDRGLLKCRYVLLYHRMFHKHTHTCTIPLKFRIWMEQWGCAEEKQTELPRQPFYMWMFVFWGLQRNTLSLCCSVWCSLLGKLFLYLYVLNLSIYFFQPAESKDIFIGYKAALSLLKIKCKDPMPYKKMTKWCLLWPTSALSIKV